MAVNIQSIIDKMVDMSYADLEVITDAARKTMEVKNNQRRKELWGNVVMAIYKYEKEVDTIECHGLHGKSPINLRSDMPGLIGLDFN